jgi:cytochrome P450
VTAGPFGCIGRQLAYHELRVLLAKTFLRLRLNFNTGFDPRAFMDGVMSMRVTEFSVSLEVAVGEIEAQ